ncbi:hypothetical protein PthstB1num2_28720 [Parageobacillus thermoglucosidasius]|nr:hypothetical protein PthstB1num2_28720 [Parageobacillus thermoglucosidasius]
MSEAKKEVKETTINIIGKTGDGVVGKGTNKSEGLGNPFKGKTFKEIEDMFMKKGFEKRGPDPLNGKGGYVNPKTGRSYYLDKGGHYKKGYEPSHVDVNRLKNSKNNLPKKKYFLNSFGGI